MTAAVANSKGRPTKGSPQLVDEDEAKLREAAEEFRFDPYGWVLFCYPWGEAGTPLEKETGPDKWQKDFLIRLGAEVKRRHEEGGDVLGAIRMACASGHGVGKSGLVSWVIHWFLSCFPGGRCTTTANTNNQLSTKTWPELSKWHKLAINRHWFVWAAQSYKRRGDPENTRADALPWSKNTTEGFAGLHAEYVLVIFDEASSIPDIIWEVTMGAMTTPGAIWLVFGNPTRNVGRFRQCFGDEAHRWIKFRVDSRSAKKANKGELDAWVQDYGEDSDFCRVRIFGKFPRASSTQFISLDLVEQAMKRAANWNVPSQPVVMAVDVARFGGDETVVYLRRGQAAKRIDSWIDADTTQSTHRIAKLIDDNRPDAIFVDANGVGAGVFDQLYHLGYPVTAVNHSAVASNEREFFNKRTEMYGDLREWLRNGGALEPDKTIATQLVSIEYGFSGKSQIQLESKEDMRRQGKKSPDRGDALAYTFYAPVAPRVSQAEIEARLLAEQSSGTSWMAA